LNTEGKQVAGNRAPVNKVRKSRAMRRYGDDGERARTTERHRRFRYDIAFYYSLSLPGEAPQSGRYHDRERERSMRSSRISASRPRKKKKQGRRNKRSRGQYNNNNDKKEVENRCLVSLRFRLILFNHELKSFPKHVLLKKKSRSQILLKFDLILS